MLRVTYCVLILALCIFIFTFKTAGDGLADSQIDRWWEIQSVDTMKLSRDEARSKLYNQEFESVIENEVAKIALIGATHIAVGTPYDKEFLPFMQKWIDAARRNDLNVWFRGNFSGWEGWFEYPLISELEHKHLLSQFISNNPQLFENGDIFTPCPECENGVVGDPRHTGKLDDFRDFLIDEFRICEAEMKKLRKDVQCGFFSMNGDVARLIMDKKTTVLLGGFVVVDHYTKTPDELITYLKDLKAKTDAKIVLGEIGVPIPDIHGNLDEREQADWISETYSLLSRKDLIYGVNYWVSTGGSTALWGDSGDARPAVTAVQEYYMPMFTECRVADERGVKITNAIIEYKGYEFSTNSDGVVKFPKDPHLEEISVHSEHHSTMTTTVDQCDEVVLKKNSGNLNKFILIIYRLLKIQS